jgi:hypothetical protein
MEENNMPGSTLLCGKRGHPYAVTVDIYRSWESEPDKGWSKKPDFIRRRLFERYVDPVRALDLPKDARDKKNGFYIMAVSCLLIETLVSFWRGWETTEPNRKLHLKGKSRRAFRLFFRVQPRFRDLNKTEFYEHIRCGILHQGETKKGWTIERTGPLFDGQGRINATKFHNRLALAIDDYVMLLKNPLTARSHRSNFDKKMKAVVANSA